MSDFIANEFSNGIIMLVIFLAVMFRVAAKNPEATGGIAKGILSMLFRK